MLLQQLPSAEMTQGKVLDHDQPTGYYTKMKSLQPTAVS